MLVRGGLFLVLLVCVGSALAFTANEANEENGFMRPRRMKLCGTRLFETLSYICMSGRQKRHAVPEPVYPGHLSPFLMSVYRPSIDDDLTAITDGGDWQMESNPVRERFQRMEALRRFNKRSPRQGVGISEMCCKKSCSIGELQLFCD